MHMHDAVCILLRRRR